MRRTTFKLSIGLVAVLGISACQGSMSDALSPADAVQTTEVAVLDNQFEPAVIEIAPGDTVTWTWQGSAPHDVDGNGFKSDVQTEGTFQYTFEAVGEYRYVCNVHPGMNGLVVVDGG